MSSRIEQVSSVQTPVKAKGKKSNTTDDSPLKELSVMSDRPSGVFVFREKSGAGVPTVNVMSTIVILWFVQL